MRRKCVDACLATAMQLLGQDAGAFLRRLAVVLLEDSQLHPRLYNEIVWLMLAVSKRYELTVADVGLIIDSIITALESEVRYNLLRGSSGENASLSATWSAIHMRAQAGGMKGDCAFLRRLADRFADGDLQIEDEWYSVDINGVSEFSVRDHIIPEAIDFHCCPAILKVGAAATGLEEAAVKEAIWWHSSSLNTRVLEDEEAIEFENECREKTAGAWEKCAAVVLRFADRQQKQLEAARECVKQIQTLDKWFSKCSS